MDGRKVVVGEWGEAETRRGRCRERTVTFFVVAVCFLLPKAQSTDFPVMGTQ